MAETNVKEVRKEPLFGKQERKLITDPLNDNNPITVQVLGICSALAVTAKMKPAFVMMMSVVFVLAMDIDQTVGGFAQDAQGNAAAIDTADIPAVEPHLAANQQVIRVVAVEVFT